MSDAAMGVENPPEIPSVHGSSWKSPCATAEVANKAPDTEASAVSWEAAPLAPRPAMNTGRCAEEINAARSWTASADGWTGSGTSSRGTADNDPDSA
jgi:hypothetical protein